MYAIEPIELSEKIDFVNYDTNNTTNGLYIHVSTAAPLLIENRNTPHRNSI